MIKLNVDKLLEAGRKQNFLHERGLRKDSVNLTLLSERTDISQATLSNIFSGKQPDIKTLCKLKKFTGLSLDQLIIEKGNL